MVVSVDSGCQDALTNQHFLQELSLKVTDIGILQKILKTRQTIPQQLWVSGPIGILRTVWLGASLYQAEQ